MRPNYGAICLFVAAGSLLQTCKSAILAGMTDVSSHLSVGGKAECISGNTVIPVKADNIEIHCDAPTNTSSATQLILKFANRDQDLIKGLLGEPRTIEAQYRVFVKLCVPISGREAPPTIVHLLTHGGTLDHTYWDMAPDYSYVDAVAAAGYATLSYDRVGNGRSEHPDPIQEVQSGVHIEVLHSLANLLRTGGIANYSFERVVGVGHSTGGWLTHGTAHKYPKDLDAIVITGVSAYPDHVVTSLASCAFQIANQDSSGRFDGLANGYLAAAPLISIHQYNFYDYPHYEDSVLQSQFKGRGTLSIGELFTILQSMEVSSYTGPVDVITGDRDFVTCGSDCHYGADGGDIIAEVQPIFIPNASSGSRSLAVPNTGHNINGHHNAKDAYEHIFSFLQDNGLGAAAIFGHDEL